MRAPALRPTPPIGRRESRRDARWRFGHDVFAVTIVALFGASGVDAQVSAPPPATPTPLFSLGGGLAQPSASVDDTHDRGIHITALGVFPIAGRLGIEVASSFVRLATDDDVALRRLGFNPETFGSLGGLIEGGERWAGSLTAGLRILLNSRGSRVVPHVSGGVGLGVSGTDDIRTIFMQEPTEHPSPEDTELVTTANVGGGLEFRIANDIALFGSWRYHVWFTDGDRLEVVPLSFGISLRLEPG